MPFSSFLCCAFQNVPFGKCLSVSAFQQVPFSQRISSKGPFSKYLSADAFQQVPFINSLRIRLIAF